MKLDENSIAKVQDAPRGGHLFGWLKTARNLSWSFAGNFPSWRKTDKERLEHQVWIKALGEVITDLDLLNRNTEQDFLRIGGKLAAFIGEVNQISSELTALGDRQYELSTSQTLTQSLECSSQMSTHNADRSGVLAEMQQKVTQLRQTLSGFLTTVSTVRTIGSLTRIETARLGNAGADFRNLADEMNTLAINVQSRIESTLDVADSLLPPVEAAIQKISTIEEGQLKDLPAIISGALAGLSSLRGIVEATTDSSAQLGGDYRMVSEAFKKLIVSIQFHDITRQQVEHVIEALRRLRSEAEAESGAIAHEQRGAAAALLALQSLQLANAADKFATSVASVTQNLNDIATNVDHMAEESRTLSGVSNDETHSFLLDMERSCTAILASLTHLDSAEADTQAIGGFLTETIGRMQESMRGIQTIEIQMHLVALNAGICAAHIGSAGDALGVIAQSMHLRAEESRECCGLLVETLDSICEGVNRIVGNRGSVSGVEPGRENNVMEQMRLAIAELHSSTERSFSQIRQIVERGARLGEELCATRTSFTVGSLFAGAISTAQQRLKQIAETIPSSLVPEGRSASESGLAEFARYYTMQAERDVHDSISLASVAAEPLGGFAEAPGFASVPAEELGENVEFF